MTKRWVRGLSRSGFEAVHNLLARYAECVDTADLDGLGVIFERAVFTHEGGTREYRGQEIHELFRKWIHVFDDGSPHTRHVITNILVDVDEDAGTAHARSYCTLVIPSTGGNASPRVVATGSYRDEFRRFEDGWWL